MKHSLLFWLCWALGWGASAGILLQNGNAIAAQQIVLKYRFVKETISVQDLSDLAETGEVSDSLRFYIERTKQDPQNIRRILTQPVTINPLLLDRVLNSPAGDIVLDQVGQVIRTSSSQENRQALRSALVLSAATDGQLALIEILQNYPSQAVQVEGEGLANAYLQLQRLKESAQAIQDLLDIWK